MEPQNLSFGTALGYISLAGKIINKVTTALKKFFKESELQNKLNKELETLFSEYIDKDLYDYIDDVAEDNLIDDLINVYINSSIHDMKDFIRFKLLSYNYGSEKTKIVEKFLLDFTDRILKQLKETVSKDDKIILKDIEKKYNSILEEIKKGKDLNFNSYELEYIFDNLFVNGEYATIKIFLDLLNPMSLNNETNALVKYNNIKYTYYCKRDLFDRSIEQYLKIGDTSYHFKIFTFILENLEIDIYKKYQHYYKDNDIIWLANLIEKNNFKNTLYFENEQALKKSAPISARILNAALISLFNYCIRTENQFIILETYKKIEKKDFYIEFFYKLFKLASLDHGDIITENNRTEAFNNIKNSLIEQKQKIDLLNEDILERFYFMFALACGDNNDSYLNILKLIPNKISHLNKIEYLKLQYKIISNIDTISLDEVLSFSEKIKEFRIVDVYLKIKKEKGNNLFDELDERQFYLDKSIFVFNSYIEFAFEKKEPQEVLQILNKYENQYKHEILYICLKIKTKFLLGDKNYKKDVNLVLYYLKDGIKQIELKSVIDLLIMLKLYDKIYKYKWEYIHISLKLYLLNQLAIVKSDKNYGFIDKICSAIIKQGYNIAEVYYYKGIALYNLNKKGAALINLKKSLILKWNLEFLKVVLDIKIQINELYEDDIIIKAKNTYDSIVQHALGVIYSRNQNIEESKIFFLRSLLINKDNKNCYNSYFSLLINPEEIHLENITGNSVITLEKIDSKEFIKICIHKHDSFFNGKKMDDLLDMKQYDIEDQEISDLIHRKLKEEVIYRNEKYYIVNIKSKEKAFFEEGCGLLEKRGVIQPIYAKSIEESIEKIKEFLRKSKQSKDKILEIYFKNKCIMPISFISEKLGVDYLHFLNYLFFYSNEKIINTVDDIDLSNINIILSFDALIMLSELDINVENIINKLNFIIPKSVFDRLSFEINKIKNEAYSSNQTGQMSYIGDEQYYFHQDTPEEKRARINYANKLSKYLNAFTHESELYDLNDEDPKINEAFTKMNCIVEMDTIGSAKTKKKCIILTDDCALYGLATRNKISCVGILCLLKKLEYSIEEYFEKLKILANRNFGRCIHLNELYEISNMLLSEKPNEEKNNILKSFANFLLTKFENEEKQKYYELYIIDLYGVYYRAGKYLENNMHNVFQDIAMSFFKKHNPQRWEEIINKATQEWNEIIKESKIESSTDENGNIKLTLIKEDKEKKNKSDD